MRPGRLLSAAAAAFIVTGAAWAAPAIPSAGQVYCMQDSDELRLLAIRPAKNDALQFALQLWLPQSGPFLMVGLAHPSGDGWRFEDTSNATQRCSVTFWGDKDGAFHAKTGKDAPCSAYAGHGGGLDEAVFPASTLEKGDASVLDDSVALTRRRCMTGKAAK